MSDVSTVELIWKFANGAPTANREGVTSWTLTSGALDRDGERIYAPGIDLSEFLANPVALGFHDRRSLPIGKWENVRLSGMGWDAKLVADLVPAPAGLSPRADEIHGMVKAGMLKGVSIGFQSLEREVGRDGALHHMSTLLLEASIVTVPANPEALRVAALGGRSNEPVLYLSPKEPTYVVDAEMMVEATRAGVECAVRKALCEAGGRLGSEDSDLAIVASKARQYRDTGSTSGFARVLGIRDEPEPRPLAPNEYVVEREERRHAPPVLTIPQKYLRGQA